MTPTFAPRTVDEVAEAIRWALSAGESFEIMGTGTKRSLGRPVAASHVLDVSALAGIVSYEPAELVLTARAGTPMQEIEAALAEKSQCLAFEPPNMARVLAQSAAAASRGGPGDHGEMLASGTLGGAIATGLSGPRRFRAGGARDHVLGIAAVSGRGEAFVGGGKVVKNVTGYDIPKLMAGSYGTLAVLTEITMKVLPAPELTRTILVTGLDVTEAVSAMTGVMQSALDVTGACYLPEKALTAFRLEGFTESVEFRAQPLAARFDAVSVLDRDESLAFWRDVRDVTALASPGEDWLWRISIPPASAARVLERLPNARYILDWAGGLLWLSGTPQIREILESGHATLFRAPADVRASTAVFHPQPAPLAALSRRVKSQFDPQNVLNPGRMA